MNTAKKEIPMTKKLKVYLLIVLAAICAACVFAGCRVGRPGREELLAGYKGQVTYYSNGGFFNKSTTITVRDVYFRNDPNMEGYNVNGVPFFDVTGTTTSLYVEREGYDLLGWYVPEVYTDGVHAGQTRYTYTYEDNAKVEHTVDVFPILDENGRQVTDKQYDRPLFARENVDEQIEEKDVRVVPSDIRITSDRLIADDDKLIVCARWVPSLKVIYKLVCEEGKTYYDASGNEYSNGSTLRQDEFGSGNVSSPSARAPIVLNGATFVRSYLDEDMQTVVGPINRPEGDEPEAPVVYAHYIDGDGWTIIDNDSSKVSSMFSGLTKATNKYYVIEDVDCSTRTLSLSSAFDTARATIVGNGHRLYNLNFGVAGGNVATQGMSYSIFGNIDDSFSLSNLKLENINISIRARGNISLYAVAHSIGNAKITGLEISGYRQSDDAEETAAITAKVTMPEANYVINAQNGNRDTWLFGGTTNDSEFLAGLTGIKITGVTTLTIEN